VPIYEQPGKLASLQFILPEDDKSFLPGGKKQGSFFIIGTPSEHFLICEGYATGASLHEETGESVVVAFDAGNLLPVAKVIRSRFPDHEIIICSDSDLSGVGQQKANEAAVAIGGLVYIPEISGADWHDVSVGGRYD
jgi:putative DNA primase/helicase